MRQRHLAGPVGSSVRFKITPRLVPTSKAARYLHLTTRELENALPLLIERGFPRPCPVIGHLDLAAVDLWLDRQSGISPPGLEEPDERDREQEVLERIARYAGPKGRHSDVRESSARPAISTIEKPEIHS